MMTRKASGGGSGRPVIFTDLDGTFLNSDDYGHGAADALVTKLRRARVPVIPNSSKTRHEIEKLRRAIGSDDPFVFENGGGVGIPAGYFRDMPAGAAQAGDNWIIRLAEGREKWLALLERSREQFGGKFRSFSEAGVTGVMEMTGLGEEDAAQALEREFGEPLLWLGTDEESVEFERFMSSHGASLVRGDRFLHVSGDCSKGSALEWLMERYQHDPGQRGEVSVAIGNSQNDLSMLDAADHAIIVRTAESLPPAVMPREGKQIIHTRKSGAEGWVEGVSGLFDRLNLTGITRANHG